MVYYKLNNQNLIKILKYKIVPSQFRKWMTQQQVTVAQGSDVRISKLN